MTDLKYDPATHDHEAFLARALKRKGFRHAYDEREAEYALVRELLSARVKAGLTQEAVAQRMGTSKSAVSRLEAGGRHSPSVTTLQQYAQAVGCDVEIRLVPTAGPSRASRRRSRAASA